MLKQLEEIRRQPENVRRRYAVLWTVSITLVVVLIWVSFIYVKDNFLDSDRSARFAESSFIMSTGESFKRMGGQIKGAVGAAAGLLPGSIKNVGSATYER